MTQQQEPQRYKRPDQKSSLLLSISLLILISGAIIRMFSIPGPLPGSLLNILLVIFAALGVIIPLLQWYSTPPIVLNPATPLPQQREPSTQINLGVSKRKGALIVTVNKGLRGSTIHLYQGFDNAEKPIVASNVIQRKIGKSFIHVADFSAFEPGNYTVSVWGKEQKIDVTIRAGHVAEIDGQCFGKKGVTSKRRFGLW